MSVNIATYNVLDNSMAVPKFFDLPEQHLKLEHRMPLILREISKFTSRKTILCLQEVGITLSGAGLHQHFASNGYYCLTSHYSSIPGRDFFGVCIVFPTDTYTLVKYGEVKIGETILVPDGIELAETKDGVSAYEEAKKRDTRMLWAILKKKSDDKEFFVATYHMPCCFWWVPVMVMHVDALLSEIDRLADGLPIILAGDFNSYLNSNTGEIIKFITSDIEFKNKPTPGWRCTSTLKLENAIISPRVTTLTKSPGREPFSATLDYIFTRGFETSYEEVQRIEGLIPNNDHGSDHIPVYAELQ